MENDKKITKITTYNSDIVSIEITMILSSDTIHRRNIKYKADKFVREIHDLLELEAFTKSKEHLDACNEEKEQLINVFGDNKIYVKEITNKYSNQPMYYNRVWLNVTTHKGIITIGWDNNSIVIDWLNSDILKDAIDIFPKENVKKYGKTIHANDYMQAKEYINILLKD